MDLRGANDEVPREADTTEEEIGDAETTRIAGPPHPFHTPLLTGAHSCFGTCSFGG